MRKGEKQGLYPWRVHGEGAGQMALTSSLLEVGKSIRGTERKKSLPASGA